MALPNPSRPVLSAIADFTAGPPNTPGASRVSLSSRGAAVTEISISRGRQYELGTVEAGTASLSIHDPGELLNPANTTSPWNSGGNSLLPYRCMQVGAWWNAATKSLAGNLLNSNNPIPGQPVLTYKGAQVSYGYDPSFEAWYLLTYANNATAAPATMPADGTYPVTAITVNASGGYYGYLPRWVPGQTYSVTMDIYAPAGSTVTAVYGSSQVSTTTTGVYQSRSLTVTAVDGHRLDFHVSAGAYPVTFYIANICPVGLIPGWSQTAGSQMRPTLSRAWDGAYSLGSVMQSANDSFSLPLATVPGLTYTVSAYCYGLSSGTVVRMSAAGTAASTNVSDAWQRLSITFDATDAVTTVSWSCPSAASYPASIYVDALQLEVGTSASAFTASGPRWYPLYTGYIERYPQTWVDVGMRGIRPLEAVDALSVLTRTVISQSYAATILADNPSVWIPYNDASLPQAVIYPSGNGSATGYTLVGNGGSVSFQGDTFLDGSPAVAVIQQNSSPPGAGDNTRITYLCTRGTTVSLNPQDCTIEVWLKVSAGSPNLGAASVPPTENIAIEPGGPQYQIGWVTAAGGILCWFYADPNGTTVGPDPVVSSGGFTGYPDDQWHYLAIRLVGGNGLNAVTDDQIGGVALISPNPSTAVGLNNFYLQSETYWNDPVTKISVAHMAVYPRALTDAQVLAHYRRGAGYVGEVSGARAARLLGQYWSSTGYTAAPGALKMAPDYDYNGRAVLEVLQEIAGSESGLVYANAAGTIVFEDRVSRYTNQTALWTFGENTAAGELPYETIEYDFDPTYVYSQVNLTRPGNSNFAPMVNSTAQQQYGQRVLSKQIQCTSDFELQQAGIFYLARYGTPKMRIRKLVLNPAANPALWSAVLSLEISQRITVKRRTSTGTTVSADYYVEQINHTIRSDGEWTVNLQLSPVFVPSAWVLGDSTYGVLGSTTTPVY